MNRNSLKRTIGALCLSTGILRGVNASPVDNLPLSDSNQSYLNRVSDKLSLGNKKDKLKGKEDLFFMAAQNSYLIYRDIDQTHYTASISGNRFVEINPIARAFFERDLWDLACGVATGATIAGTYLSYKIDKTGKFARTFNLGIALAEAIVLRHGVSEITKDWGFFLPEGVPTHLKDNLTITLLHLRY